MPSVLNLIADLLTLTIVKSHANIVFIGHVDAGKSTMGGNLLFLTGMVVSLSFFVDLSICKK